MTDVDFLTKFWGHLFNNQREIIMMTFHTVSVKSLVSKREIQSHSEIFKKHLFSNTF